VFVAKRRLLAGDLEVIQLSDIQGSIVATIKEVPSSRWWRYFHSNWIFYDKNDREILFAKKKNRIICTDFEWYNTRLEKVATARLQRKLSIWHNNLFAHCWAYRLSDKDTSGLHPAAFLLHTAFSSKNVRWWFWT